MKPVNKLIKTLDKAYRIMEEEMSDTAELQECLNLCREFMAKCEETLPTHSKPKGE